MINRVGIAFLAALSAVAAPAVAQAPPIVKLGLEDAPQVGRQAPDVVLPYATSTGPGPADQPFDLRKELGHIVVLAFYPGDFTPGCTAQWRTFGAQADSLIGSGVVLVGVSGDLLGSHQRFAEELGLPFKLLTDRDHVVARRFAASDGRRQKRMVVVVGRDGRVRYVDPSFAEVDPESYAHLASAIAKAKEIP